MHFVENFLSPGLNVTIFESGFLLGESIILITLIFDKTMWKNKTTKNLIKRGIFLIETISFLMLYPRKRHKKKYNAQQTIRPTTAVSAVNLPLNIIQRI